MPNKNAYLAVCFNDATRVGLVELQDAVAGHLERESHTFDRMDPQELHMTFFFAGEQLSQLKPGELRAWHAQIVAAVQRANLDTIRMRLSGISVFPPDKFNLVVARFDVPARLHELQRRVGEGARSAGIASSGSQADLEGGAWVPHVRCPESTGTLTDCPLIYCHPFALIIQSGDVGQGACEQGRGRGRRVGGGRARLAIVWTGGRRGPRRFCS